jgi:predicted DNA-binding protein YlxM (UPF0122 family)
MNTDKNYKELWEAIVKEQEAKLELLDAQKKMERAEVLDEMKDQFDATTEWTEAKWDEFIAKISRWYNEE